MNRPKIKVGFCVAYDWVLLKDSIPRVYDNADEICLSIDKYRTSWSGAKKYEFDENAFRSFINQIDTGHKIRVYEDFFLQLKSLPLKMITISAIKWLNSWVKVDGIYRLMRMNIFSI